METKTFEASEFVGLSKKRCQDRCEQLSLIFRLLSVDGEPFFSMPEDIRTDRVCVDIVDERVVSAVIQ